MCLGCSGEGEAEGEGEVASPLAREECLGFMLIRKHLIY